jgi:hypothetical protein
MFPFWTSFETVPDSERVKMVPQFEFIDLNTVRQTLTSKARRMEVILQLAFN